jgi:hypothetical protein
MRGLWECRGPWLVGFSGRLRALILMLVGFAALSRMGVAAGDRILLDLKEVRVTSPLAPEKWAWGPFFPLRLKFENRTDRPLEVRVVAEDRLHNAKGGADFSVGESSFQVAPGSTLRDVFLPVANHHGGAYRTLAVQFAERPVHMSAMVRNGGGFAQASYVVVTPDGERMEAEISTGLKRLKPRDLSGRFSGRKVAPAPMPAAYPEPGGVFVELDRLPVDPRVLLNASGIWMRVSDWNRSGATVRRTLGDWVRAGGWLHLHRDAQAVPVEMDGHTWEVGLGRVIESGELEASADAAKKLLDGVVALDENPYPGRREDYQGWESTLVPRFGLNATVLILFLAGFSVIAVPVNLLFFAPSARRHRLFVTIPLISVLALVLLVGAVVTKDGLGGQGIRNGLLVMTPGEVKAPIYQEQLSRCGMLSMSGFEFPEEMSIVMLHHDSAGRFVRSGKELSGDWFRSRQVQGQVIQGWIASRSAVELKGHDETGRPLFESTVPWVLGPVHFVGMDGKHWRVDELRPGVRATLKEVAGKEFERWIQGAFEEPSENLQARLKLAASRRGWFFGVTQDPAAFVGTSPQIVWKRDRMMCAGPVGLEGTR